MFSVGSSPPQIAVPLSQLANVWSSFRSASRGLGPAQNAVHKSTRVNDGFQVAVPQSEETINIRELNSSVKQTLTDLGFSDLSTHINIDAVRPSDISDSTLSTAFRVEQLPSAQMVISQHSGFPTSSSSSTPSPGGFTVTLPGLPGLGVLPRRGWSNKFSNSVFRNPVRGFKTRRSTGSVGIGSKTTEDESPSRTALRDTVFGPAPKKKPETLPTLISEYDGTPEVQEKLRIAFAEGYAANSKNNTADRPTLQQRVMRLILWGVGIYLVLLLWQTLLSYNGGGRVKLNPLKDEGYEALNPDEVKVTFRDVLGCDEAKQELQDIVAFLENPKKFEALGAKLPKGVLLVGPPGIGKTLLARAVAGEAKVAFFHMSGSEFDEVFVGTGAKRVRGLFEAAKNRAPCVIFIDEIDTVGAKRTSSSIHPYANQTINQLLSEMDGFMQNSGVIVLGATNRKDNLDRALLRPGRFDVEVRVFPPDLKGRMDILKHYMKKINIAPDVNAETLARGTTGCTGADLENMVNQAALKAALEGVPFVNMAHLEFARDKVLMGPAKKTKIPDEETNLCTAYHEAGHTLVAYYTKGSVPLHKVTIVPRGMSLGHTSFMPDKEQYNHTRGQLLAQMDVAMGGRVAEELTLGPDNVTTGAGSDFQTATSIAIAMVKNYGMSDTVGVRVFGDDSHDGGLSFVKVNDLSPAMQEVLDLEIKRLLQESYERAKTILKTHKEEHKALAQALMKYETLDVDDIQTILQGKNITRPIIVNTNNHNSTQPLDPPPETEKPLPLPKSPTEKKGLGFLQSRK